MSKKILLFQPYYDLKGHFESFHEINKENLSNNGFQCFSVLGREKKKPLNSSSFVFKSFTSNKILRIISSFKGLSLLKKVSRSKNISVIHFLDFEIFTLSLFLRLNRAFFLDKKIILTLHSVNYLKDSGQTLFRKIYRNMIVSSYRYLDQNLNIDVVTNGETLTKTFQRSIPLENSRIITSSWGANKVDDKQLNDNREFNSFLFLGIIRKDKNLEYLLNQFSMVQKKFTLTIAGMPFDYDMEELEEIILQSGIDTKMIRTHFEFIDDSTYEELLNEHKYIVLPYSSDNQSSSGPLIQALQHEIIPIVSNYGERGSIVEKNNLGYSFEFDSENSLKEIVENILEKTVDNDLFSENIRMKKEDFLWKNLIKNLIYTHNVYE